MAKTELTATLWSSELDKALYKYRSFTVYSQSGCSVLVLASAKYYAGIVLNIENVYDQSFRVSIINSLVSDAHH